MSKCEKKQYIKESKAFENLKNEKKLQEIQDYWKIKKSLKI